MSICISSDRSKLDLTIIHNFLQTAYWSEKIAIDPELYLQVSFSQ
ncbi:hypothetical protein [Microcoleus sp. FACHB-1515]|nr:hypothetical protein [Microcoleus sp. FACHB-1515]